MGADIHVYAEYNADGSWMPSPCQPLREPVLIWRDYNLFGILAPMGRRASNWAIAECRGLPTNMSKWAVEFFGASEETQGLHHYSWLTFAEILETPLSPELNKIRIRSHFYKWLEFVKVPYVALDNQRVIFAFDN